MLLCRRLKDTDVADAADLLAAGFPERNVTYWRRALDRLRRRAVPDGWPRYGYVLADGESLVGIVLLIFVSAEGQAVRANVSSWYVKPTHRGYSHILLAAALRLDGVTLFNISPAPDTIDTISAQGFSRYVDGTLVCVPAVGRPARGSTVRRITAQDRSSAQLLRDHAAWGCLSFEVSHDGRTSPFVFVRRSIGRGLVPCAQLVYCRDVRDFVRFSGPLGRHLLRHGLGVVLIDANGPIEGLRGVFRPKRSPKFYRGPTPPRLADLSYTELAIFGS